LTIFKKKLKKKKKKNRKNIRILATITNFKNKKLFLKNYY